MCVELDADQTPDAVNYLYFCHNARNLVSVGQRVKSGDALAVMGCTGNAALASPPFAHCHFEVRATAAGAGLDPTAYTGHPNAVGTDVYKRQEYNKPFLDAAISRGDVIWMATPINHGTLYTKNGELTGHGKEYFYLCSKGYEPVSYTHLDVYRRQVQLAAAVPQLRSHRQHKAVSG